ncbi:hypothetical protein JST97_26650 [bacterium]|nr:hypothetical protein [bacterium]
MKGSRGLTIAEVVLGLGLVGLAFFALLSVCSLGTRFNQQSMVSIKAAQLADSELSRTIAAIVYNVPLTTGPGIQYSTPGRTFTDFWHMPPTGPNFPYPGTPWSRGVATIGADQINFAIYATTLAGVGGVSPENVVARLDAYVWWKEDGPGNKMTSCTRLMVYGEDS